MPGFENKFSSLWGRAADYHDLAPGYPGLTGHRHNPQEPDDRQDFGKEVSHRLSAAGCPGQFHDKEHVVIRVACPQLVIGLPYRVLAGHQPNLFQHNRLAEIDF